MVCVRFLVLGFYSVRDLTFSITPFIPHVCAEFYVHRPPVAIKIDTNALSQKVRRFTIPIHTIHSHSTYFPSFSQECPCTTRKTLPHPLVCITLLPDDQNFPFCPLHWSQTLLLLLLDLQAVQVPVVIWLKGRIQATRAMVATTN